MIKLKLLTLEYAILNPVKKISLCKKLSKGVCDKKEAFQAEYNNLEKDLGLKVDYPYSYLKNYLNGHHMEELAKEVDWNGPEDRKSKSFISDLISYLTEKEFAGMKQIKRREAHIRFMNSAYHSQRTLFFCALFVFSVVSLLLTGRLFWLVYVKFDIKSFSYIDGSKIEFFIDRGYKYISRIISFENLFLILCVSVVYMLFYRITKRLVLGSFHYQRIREIVHLLQSKIRIDKYELNKKGHSVISDE